MNLGTDSLPTEAVGHPLKVTIRAGADPEHRRRGDYSVTLKYGGLVDPHLTVNEARYVVAVIEMAAAQLRELYEVRDEPH